MLREKIKKLKTSLVLIKVCFLFLGALALGIFIFFRGGTDLFNSGDNLKPNFKSTAAETSFTKVTAIQGNSLNYSLIGEKIEESDFHTLFLTGDGESSADCIVHRRNVVFRKGVIFRKDNISGGFSCGDSVTFDYKGASVTYGTVAVGSQCWMDRNLGASRVATAYNDVSSYGDYFQWGREDDGHQASTSATVEGDMTLTTQPGHGNFITEQTSPYDWATSTWRTRWLDTASSVTAADPCPTGWRVPLQTEWDTAMITLGLKTCSSDCLNAMANSTLKIPSAGNRYYLNGSLLSQGTYGRYWSSSPSSTYAYYLVFDSTGVNPASSNYRANGLSIRCLKD